MLCSVGSVWGQEVKNFVFDTTQDEEGFSINWADPAKMFYKKKIEGIGEVSIEFPLVARAGDKCIVLEEGGEAFVHAPSGYVVTYIKADFCEKKTINFNFAPSGSSYEVKGEYTSAEYSYTSGQRSNVARMANRASMGSSSVHIKQVTVRVHKDPTISIDGSNTLEVYADQTVNLKTILGGEPTVTSDWHLLESGSSTPNNKWWIGHRGDGTLSFKPNEGFTFPNNNNVHVNLTVGNEYRFSASAFQGCIGGNGWESSPNVIFTVKVKEPLKITSKPKCNVELGNDGGNYFGLNNLNAGPGVTISETTEGWTKVTTGSENGYVSFNFAESYNLKDLDSWAVTDDPSVYGNVDAVEFFNGGTKIRTYNNDAGHRNSITQELKNELTAVDEIRIYFKKNTETAFNWIRFKFVHKAPTLPTLTNGTVPEMLIRVGESLELSNTPGYWRQYANNEYSTPTNEEINGVKIPTDEWKSAYKFTGMQTGHYYFGARDSGDPCHLGYSHPETDLVKVHVEVTDQPLVQAKTDPEGLDATFDIYMGPDNKDWKVSNPGFVNFGTHLSFAVSDVPGYEFVGWYLDGTKVSNDKVYNYNNNTDGVWADVTAVAKFKREYNNNNFTGYYPFINRLRAQWNFDLCDEIRFKENELGSNWTKDQSNILDGTGYIEYFYHQSLNYDVLTYGNGHEIPISAGLKFKAAADQVSIRVNYKNGKMTGTNLVCKEGVRMTVPYIENSCRNDRGEDYPSVVNHSDEQIQAARTLVFSSTYVEGTDKDAENIARGNFTQAEIDAAKATVSAADYVQGSDLMAECAATKSGACNTSYIANAEGFQNCMHHMKRDILYVALEEGKDFVDPYVQDGGGYFVNDAIVNDEFTGNTMFNAGGTEEVNGKNWSKGNFLGVPGAPCTFQLRRDAVFERLAVNRNLTASYYTEYIDKMGYDTPQPGMRIRVDTKGLRVASDGSTSGYWDGAISMTYGGWSLNGTKYNNYNGAEIKDEWTENTVFNGNDPSLADVTKIPTPSDGFPIISNTTQVARSESLMPSTSTDKYHLGNEGMFSLASYKDNLTPWTLPCRGAYVKFEPTHPGVLNIHVVQEAGKEYYIADEFGKRDKDVPNSMTWAKGATVGNVITYNSTTGGWSSAVKDYVKYSFNVYPGKSYYFFSNNAPFGFAGFFFEPYVCRINNSDELAREDILMETWSFSDSNEYTAPAKWYPDGATQVYIGGNAIPGVYSKVIYSPKKAGLDPNTASESDMQNNTEDWQPYTINYSRNAIKATYTRDGAGFQANKWTSICLPFSMNQYQMEDQFGVGTKVVMLRDIQDNKSGIPTTLTTANFIMHENQDIIAGYPYFIKPTKSTHSITANVSLYETTPTIPVIESAGVNPSGDSYNGIKCFQFTGNFTTTEVPAGSYVMTNDGVLTRTTNAVNAKPYRAFLKYTGTGDTPTSSKVIKAANYDFLADEEGMEESTTVEEILFQSGIFADKANVYNVSGQLVRANADNLQGLPKGIYIVNGKKFIVK